MAIMEAPKQIKEIAMRNLEMIYKFVGQVLQDITASLLKVCLKFLRPLFHKKFILRTMSSLDLVHIFLFNLYSYLIHASDWMLQFYSASFHFFFV